MVELIVKQRLFISDAKIKDAQHDYDMQTDPRNFITYNDNYHERGIRDKWGMSSSDLGKLLKKAKRLSKRKK